ncbi:MAG: bifunctional hydroxymethylpyrimidine kinase/phosphomethylpyrimidine kinase [Pyrinomonadaceae bacterium]
MDRNHKIKVCLTIAGLDPSGGAGIIADIKTFSAFGCYSAAAIASITFQNTTGVFGAVHQTADTVRNQVEPILRDFAIDATKTGMLPTREVIEETARLIEGISLPNFVVDPVVRSTSGFDLIDDEALRVLIAKLFPLAAVITPNIPEAERIARMTIASEADVEKAAKVMQSQGAKNVLIKGGHLPLKVSHRAENLRLATDFLFADDTIYRFEDEYIETDATHGTGCTLAAAITANLAHGKTLQEAITISKAFVTKAIRTAPAIGKGHSPINSLLSRREDLW